MADTVNSMSDVQAVRRDVAAPWWPVLGVLAVLWFFAVRQLRFEWTINPQYTYGWIVPFLAAYLFLERWKYRPAPGLVRSKLAIAIAILPLVLLLLPIRLVQESAPDWRFVGWALGGVCVAISLSAVYFAGGRSWLLHFAFPVAFFLIAVPWPVPIEQSLIQWLMRSVTGICVEALSWAEIPAVQKGNVIEISNGRVGVEEACSGVRSLQTTLMIALFMGELLRFGILRRAILLAGALGVAYVCNLARTYFLVWVSARSGMQAVGKYHDSVGMGVLIASLVGVGILCLILNWKRAKPADETAESDALRPGLPPPKGILIGLVVWFVVVEVGTEAWYRVNESRTPPASAWTVRWPTGRPGYRDIEFSEITRTLLRYTNARSGAWIDPDGSQWMMFFIRWDPGRTSAQLARSHGPEICLAAGGWVMKEDLGLRQMRINGVDLPVHAYTFRVGDRLQHVFYCLWEQRPDAGAAQSTAEDLTVGSRLDSVRRGLRNAGQQAIEIAVGNVPGPAEAEAAVKRFLEQAIQP